MLCATNCCHKLGNAMVEILELAAFFYKFLTRHLELNVLAISAFFYCLQFIAGPV